MDSLTQIALGGAVGYAVLGSKVGRKAIVWGAVLGTLPDLDVFLPYSGEVEAFTYHRGFSHSFLVHLLISPLIAWLITKLHASTRAHYKGWVYLVFLSLATHAILDSFTVYGTQLMWPFTEYPVGVSNLFIIDPLYTLPLLIGLIIASIPKVSKLQARRVNGFGIAISSMYIIWTLFAKVMVDHTMAQAIQERGIREDAYLSTPAPLNTLLWRVLIMSENGYYEAYVSIFDEPSEVSLDKYTSSPELLAPINDEWAIQRLKWFTKGFYSIRQVEQSIILSDLRMGVECSYAFNFVVGEITAQGTDLGSFEKVTQRPELSQVQLIWDRIWDPSISLAPALAATQCLEPPA